MNNGKGTTIYGKKKNEKKNCNNKGKTRKVNVNNDIGGKK